MSIMVNGFSSISSSQMVNCIKPKAHSNHSAKNTETSSPKDFVVKLKKASNPEESQSSPNTNSLYTPILVSSQSGILMQGGEPNYPVGDPSIAKPLDRPTVHIAMHYDEPDGSTTNRPDSSSMDPFTRQ